MRSLYTLITASLFTTLILLSPSEASAAFIELNPDNAIHGTDYTFTVAVEVDTEGKNTTTADIVLSYDPDMVDIISITQPTENRRMYTRIFPEVDKDEQEIYIGAYVLPGSPPVNGAGQVAYIHMRGKQPGTTAIELDCTDGLTTDSNVSGKEGQQVEDFLDCSKSRGVSMQISDTHQSGPHLYMTRIDSGENDTHAIGIGVDTRGEEIIGIDAFFPYDPSLLDVESFVEYAESMANEPKVDLEIGTFENDIENNTVYIGAIDGATGDEAGYIGRGLFAVMNLKPLTQGAMPFVFTCETGATDESNILSKTQDATDIIDCTDVGPYRIEFGPVDPEPTPPGGCLALTGIEREGDYNCDGTVSLADFEVWRTRYIAGEDSLRGFEVWRKAFTDVVIF